MSARAYILGDIVAGKPKQVVRLLESRPGVVRVDLLEGPPDLLVVFEASSRPRLARITVEAMAVVDPLMGNVSMLPVRTQVSPVSSTWLNTTKQGRKIRDA